MSSGNELITFVIPTRNAAPDVAACLRSLQAQQFKDFEARVVDGKSSDGTREIVDGFSDNMGRGLVWTSQPDQGLYDAMNRGIADAKGEWLCFFGADDLLHDSLVLADVSGHLAAVGVDIVYGDVMRKSNDARYGGEYSLDRLLFKENICHQAIFYRRSVFERLGGYDLRYPVWADWEFNIRCFRHPNIRTHWIDRVIAIYNDGSGVSREEDPILSRELPVILRRDAERRIADTLNRRSHRLGRKLFGWLDD